MNDGSRPERGADGGEFLAGFFTGALAGAALALLLTPQSGDDARYALRATIRKLSNRARDLVADMAEETNEQQPTTDPVP